MVNPEAEVVDHKPREIRIYAYEHVITHRDHVTKQGFGGSTPLESPIKRKYYDWKGNLWPSDFERKNPKSKRAISSLSTRETVEELARNFSRNYLGHLDPELERKGEASYTLIFEPTEEIITDLRGRRFTKVRSLTPEERDKFMEAFKKENQAANLPKWTPKNGS